MRKISILLMVFISLHSISAYCQLFGWNYLTPLTIVETSGTPLYNYQAKVVINTTPYISANQMSTTGSDIRFGNDQYGTVLYSYWIESGINTNTTTIWIKLDTLLGYQCKTIYMFYGNNSAPIGSSIDSTLTGPFSATDYSQGNGAVSNSANRNVGFTFTANSDMVVTQLGRYDYGVNNVVTLWDAPTYSVIGQLTVNGNTLTNYYAPLSNPIWLTNGRNYTLTVLIGSTGTQVYSLSSHVNSHLSFVDSRYRANSYSGNDWPNTQLANQLNGLPDMIFYTKTSAPSAPTYFIGTNSLQLSLPHTITECRGHALQIGDTATGATGPLSYIWTPSAGLSNSHIAQPTVNLTTDNTYTLNARDGGTGCIASASVTVHVVSPVASTITDSVCHGGTYVVGTHSHSFAGTYVDTLQNQSAEGCDSIVTLHLSVHTIAHPVISYSSQLLSAGSYATYQWLLNGAPVSGATASTLTPATNGLYAVIVTDAAGCTDTSAAYNVTAVDINEPATSFMPKVFPNPVTEQLNVTADEDILSLTVSDMLGQIVYSLNALHGSSLTIATNNWQNGLYIVTCKGAQGTFIQKLIKQ